MLNYSIEPVHVDTQGRRVVAGALCVGGGAVALEDGKVIIWAEGVAPRSVSPGFAPASICLSNDGAHLGALASGGAAFVLIDARSRQTELAIAAPDARRQPIVAAIAESEQGPLALFSRTAGELAAFHPRTREGFTRSLATFRVGSLQPLAMGKYLGLLGHFEGETKDSLAVSSVQHIVASHGTLQAQLAKKTGFSDYAYRLGLGPCAQDGMVGCRDPEDDEEEIDPSAGPLHGLRGFYARRVDDRADGPLDQSLAWEKDIPSGPAVCAGGGIVAWREQDHVLLAPLAQPHETITVAASWLSCAPDGSAVLVATPAGDLGLLRWRL